MNTPSHTANHGTSDADAETLATAMTRPSMLGGFTLSSIGVSLYLPWMAALLSHSLQPLVLVPILLAASYLVCLKDVFLFDIAGAALRLKICRNKRLWDCRRYAPR